MFLAALMAAALLAPASALAQSPAPAAAVDAYRESIPTAQGPHPAGSGSRRSLGPPLQRAIVVELGSDPTGKLLRRVATSPKLGAPAIAPPAASEPLRAWSVGRGASAVEAAVRGISDRALGLIVALGAITVIAVAASVRRRRSPAQS